MVFDNSLAGHWTTVCPVWPTKGWEGYKGEPGDFGQSQINCGEGGVDRSVELCHRHKRSAGSHSKEAEGDLTLRCVGGHRIPDGGFIYL